MSSAGVLVLPNPRAVGGPASFRARLIAGLVARGVAEVTSVDDPACRAMLVIAGTNRLGDLIAARRRGIRIVQRLNGMNWIHRVRRTGLRHALRSEVNNLVLAIIRRGLAGRIVYQSEFSRGWWERVYGPLPTPASVVYNGVDLTAYTPAGPETPPGDRLRLLLIEGRLSGGNEAGLENALALARELSARAAPLPVELAVAGEAPPALRSVMEARYGLRVDWLGVVPRGAVPALARSAHVLFSADVNAACPNSVVEALACGLPVAAFDTGALGEMLRGGAGRVVPWGADYWRLEPADLPALAQAVLEIAREQDRYRAAARRRAEQAFGLDSMLDGYLDALFG